MIKHEITFTRFIGFGISWAGEWVNIFLPFIIITFYKYGKGFKFVNDWEL